MNEGKAACPPPIERSIEVSWEQRAAFDRFCHRFAEWWPVQSHSIGERRVERLIFEPRVDGIICEEHADGRRFQWGQVTLWDPPNKVGFAWHPSRHPETAQDVEVSFIATPQGTKVTLTSWGWERWGRGAKAARRGYHMGWGYILKVFGQQRTLGMSVLDLMIPVARFMQWMRGGLDAAINRAGGEITRAERPQ